LAQITGIIEKVWENQTSAGTTYAYVVDNTRYGSYKTKLNVQEGDNVTFSATQKGNFWNIDTKTVKKLAAPAGNTADKPSPEAKSWGGGKRDASVQDAINYQSARKDALQLLDTLASNGIIDFGTEKTATTKKFATALAYVDKLTVRFFEDTKALGHKAAEPEQGEQEDAPVKAAPVKKAKAAPKKAAKAPAKKTAAKKVDKKATAAKKKSK
jgi:hypothetical protein